MASTQVKQQVKVRQRYQFVSAVGFRDGAKDCISVSLAGIIFGFVFGVLASAKGMTFAQTLMMSAVIYAGAAQMVSLELWSPIHIATMTLVITCFIVCLRYILMGMAVRPLFEGLPAWRAYSYLFFMIDENWALTILKNQKRKRSNWYISAYFLGAGLLFYVCWVIGTIIGHKLAYAIKHPDAFGLDFAFTAIFLGILVGMWRDRRDVIPWTIALIAALLAKMFVPGNWYIVIGALIGSFAGVWREYASI